MKELFRSKLGKNAVKALIWGLIGIAIAAAENGLLILVIEIGDTKNIENVFIFLYGLFYCLIIASYFVIMASVITLLVMIIAKYSKRCFGKRIH
jgi:large-conductance mechanosensitive channel